MRITWDDLLRPGDAQSFFARDPLPIFDPELRAYSAANAWWLAELSRIVYRLGPTETASPLRPLRSEWLATAGFDEVEFIRSDETGTGALLVQARRDWIQPLEELVDGPGPGVDRMRAVIAWMAQPATADVMRIHMSIYVFALSDEQVRERYAAEYARWRAPFVTLYRQLGRELGIEGLDAKSVGEAFASAADGLVQQQVIDPGLPTARMLRRLFEATMAQAPMDGPTPRRSQSRPRPS